MYVDPLSFVSKNRLDFSEIKKEKKPISNLEKNIKIIEGDGMKELTDKLKNLNVKDTMKNIRITF